MQSLVILSVLVVSLTMPGQLLAGDTAAGKAKAANCATCHGKAGISTGKMTPNLAGQKEGYLQKALQDFRSGARKDAMMNTMAKTLSDEDIANIAAYYASLSSK